MQLLCVEDSSASGLRCIGDITPGHPTVIHLTHRACTCLGWFVLIDICNTDFTDSQMLLHE